MGYCEIIPFKDGNPQTGIEFHNPWRGAARVWDALFERYLKNPEIPYHSWLSSYSKDKGSDLWDLAKSERLQLFERACHAFTFDLAYVRRENFGRFVADLRAFDRQYPVDYPSHLSAWAELLETLDAEAVGLYGTSVSRNPWYEYDEEKDETTPRVLADGFEIYDWLAESAAGRAAAEGSADENSALNKPESDK